MNYRRMYTRLIPACIVAMLLMMVGGMHTAIAQNTESFAATHFSVPEGSNEVPPVDGDDGYAVAIMQFDPMAGSLQYRVTVALPAGQTITAAHFHIGTYGENGPPVHDIVFPPNSMTATGIWTNIGSAELAALVTQGIYLNIHTNANPNGQLRDQVNMLPNLSATEMSSAEEVPSIPDMPGTGNAVIYLNPAEKRAIYAIDWDSLSGPPTMAHFHRGARGEAGPPIHTIALPVGAGTEGHLFGLWDGISDSDIETLKNGGFYVNIHTAQNANGEIRGQVVSTEFYTAAISPANEVPPVTGSTGEGTGFVTLIDKREIRSFFVVEGLTGPASMAHLHNAPRGTNGNVVYNLFGLAMLGYPGVWLSFTDVLTGNYHAEFRNEAMYANFHTAQFAGGEARGQLISSAHNLDQPTSSVAAPRHHGSVAEIPAWYDASSGMVTVQTLTPGTLRNATIALYSLLGARVAAVPVAPGEKAVHIGSLPAGVYFIQLMEEGTPIGVGRVAVVR